MQDIQDMLQDIRAEVDFTRRMIGRDRLDPAVMAAMKRVPRHEFVDAGLRARAYANGPLQIGHGQTISQPYIVALMTDLAGLGRTSRVLEVGTGSGYQAAVLAELVADVYTIEIIPALAKRAAERLAALGYRNVHAREGDGYHGWPAAAPFDAVLVTAAAPAIPQPLIDQLKPGGRLVVPVGPAGLGQELLLLEKTAEGDTRTREILPVAFVPLTGRH